MVFCTNPYMFRFSRAIKALLDLKQSLVRKDIAYLCQTIRCQPEEIPSSILRFLHEDVVTP